MAVKTFEKKSKSNKKQKHSFLLAALIIAFVGVIAISCALNYAQAAKNNREAEGISEQCSEVKKENEELERFLEDKNHDEYIEKIAREEYGYAKPGERVYYDSSFGN